MGTAVYRKNIRRWEQWSRVLVGATVMVAAVVVPEPAGKAALVVVGLLLIATGVAGWCPACAAVGRRLERERNRVAQP